MPSTPDVPSRVASVIPLHSPASDLQQARHRLSEALGLIEAACADASRACKRGRGTIKLQLLTLAIGNLRWRAERVLAEVENAVERVEAGRAG